MPSKDAVAVKVLEERERSVKAQIVLLNEDLAGIRRTLEFLRRTTQVDDLGQPSSVADACDPPESTPASVFAFPTSSSSSQTIADFIDRVLDVEPVGADTVFKRMLTLPGVPPDVKIATVRWNLNHFKGDSGEGRGWVRSGTRTRALWSKPQIREAANA